jgi:hypothetical protein
MIEADALQLALSDQPPDKAMDRLECLQIFDP